MYERSVSQRKREEVLTTGKRILTEVDFVDFATPFFNVFFSASLRSRALVEEGTLRVSCSFSLSLSPSCSSSRNFPSRCSSISLTPAPSLVGSWTEISTASGGLSTLGFSSVVASLFGLRREGFDFEMEEEGGRFSLVVEEVDVELDFVRRVGMRDEVERIQWEEGASERQKERRA